MFGNEVVILTITGHNGVMSIFISLYAAASVMMILWAR